MTVLASIQGYGRAASVAAVALVAVQVGVAIIFKLAQQADGRFEFSQSSSLALSEFAKLIISACLFYRQWCSRPGRHDGTATATYSPLRPDYEDEEALGDGKDDHINVSEIDLEHASDEPNRPERFPRAVCQEISVATAYGMAHLALLYAIVNNGIFLLYRLTDLGTISLARSGITLFTVLSLWVSIRRRINKAQWVAMLLQICGVTISQYSPGHGMLYPGWTYFVLVFQTTISACAAVYNQQL